MCVRNVSGRFAAQVWAQETAQRSARWQRWHPTVDPGGSTQQFEPFGPFFGIFDELEKSIFAKGLNFSMCPNKLNYADYRISFECFSGILKNINVLHCPRE